MGLANLVRSYFSYVSAGMKSPLPSKEVLQSNSHCRD